jgi:hypothetical protein
MVFFELRWNYSPLKEEAVLLPDGLFILLVASRQSAREFCHAEESFCSWREPLGAPRASRHESPGEGRFPTKG